jgi:hypothetical protein
VLHWIEIIGEAARGVSDKVRTAHPEVPWRVITDMRNRVSHGYFAIDLDVVWNTVTRDLPKLQESVTRILAELDSESRRLTVSSLPARRWLGYLRSIPPLLGRRGLRLNARPAAPSVAPSA